MAVKDTYGLTINQWPGTWSPSAKHPIVLDAEIRGGIRTITGDSADRLSNISGQRLQDGMIVYVQKTNIDSAHDSLSTIDGQQYYKYSMLAGEYRDSNTGNLLNAKDNWSLIRLGIGLDSSEIIQLVDSDYVNTRVNFDPIYDAIDASIQVIDIMDFIGSPGLNDQFLISNGDNSFRWQTFGSLGLDSDRIITLIDSDYINARVDTNIDSVAAINLITQTVNTAYIDARVTNTGGGGGVGTVDSPAVIDLISEFCDSYFILSIVDSAFIQRARPQYVDSAYLNDVVDAKIQTIDLEDLVDQAEHAGQYFISSGTGGAVWKTITSLGLDSEHIITLIDSDYVNARTEINSATIQTIIDQAYIESQITQSFLVNTLPEDFGAGGGIDSLATLSLIDSAYILTIVDSAFIQNARPQYVDSAYLNDIVDAKLQVFNLTDNLTNEPGLTGQYLKYDGHSSFTWKTLIEFDSELITGIFNTTSLNSAQLLQTTNAIPLIVDSDYVNDRIDFNLSSFIDSVGAPADVLHAKGDGTYYWSRLDKDSDTIIQITNIVKGNVEIPGVELPNVLDSAQIIAFIDADYINARATFEIDSGEVVDIIYETVDSAFFYQTVVDVSSALVDAKIQSIDLGDIVGGNGNAGQYLKSLGNGDTTWVNLSVEIEDQIKNTSVDSLEVLNLINSSYINSLVDPSTITTIIDSDYINFRVDAVVGGGGVGTVDSPAVIDLIIETVDTSFLTPLVISTINTTATDLVQATIQTLDVGDLVGGNGSTGQFLVSRGNGQANWATFGSFGLDSNSIYNLIDSDYINNRVSFDSNETIQLIDSDYILSRITFELGNVSGVDSVATIDLIHKNSIDSLEAVNLIQEIGLDSAEITQFVRDLIQANIQVIDFNEVFGIGYGAQGTYLRSAGGSNFDWSVIQVDSSVVVPTVLDVLDSAFLQTAITPGFINDRIDRSLFLDSSEAIQLIDSDYINARVVPAVDSLAVIGLIDSDYINARVDPAVDSLGVLALIDSDYINSRIETGTDSSTVLDIVLAEINALDIGDIIGDNGVAGYYLKSLGNGHAEWTEVVAGGGGGGGGLTQNQVLALIDGNTFDSADVTGIINSSYVTGIINSSYVTGIINSSYVTGIINSNYINATIDRSLFLDSSEAIQLIDSDYINARVVPAVDSLGVIGLIDSDYINSRIETGTDSSTVLDIVLAEINALDIGDVVGDNGSAGQLLKSAGNGSATWETGIVPKIGGSLTLGETPAWSGSIGIDSASKIAAGQYSITFTTPYNAITDYSVITTYQGNNATGATGASVRNFATHFDIFTSFDSGAVSVLIYQF